MSQYILQIVWNIIGGIIVTLLAWLFPYFLKKYYKCKFKGLFGKDSTCNFFIIYGQMSPKTCFDEKGNINEWPYYKKSGGKFKVSSVVSFSQTRSVKYLSEIFGKVTNISPKLISDEEIEEKLDISFCSVGGLNNLKTLDILKNKDNVFYDFDASGSTIISKINSEKKFSIEGNYDYGFIIKIKPKNFTDRVWIAIAGIGEWGTSGAAWFLSNKWNEMPKTKSFGVIVKVRAGKDESAEEVDKIEE